MLERQWQLELDIQKEKSYQELTATKDNFKLFEIENKTQQKIQPTSDISKKDFVVNLKEYNSHPVTGSHKEDKGKNPSQYFKIFIDN